MSGGLTPKRGATPDDARKIAARIEASFAAADRGEKRSAPENGHSGPVEPLWGPSGYPAPLEGLNGCQGPAEAVES